MSFVFLSYAGIDRKTAIQVQRELTAAGLDVWMDVDRIHVADNWIEKLQEAISNSSAYVILIGPSGIKRWVSLELNVALNRNAESNDKYPICPIMLSGVELDDLPPFLTMFQAVNLPPNPAPEDYERIANDISERINTNRPILLDQEVEQNECPFPGLMSYNEQTAKYYFGRQLETLDALALLGSIHDGTYRPWLQIEGPSGVGKSSLVKAGLIPAIRRGWIEEKKEQAPRNWQIAVMRPGKDPIYNLAEALTRTLEDVSSNSRLSELRATLRGTEPDALRDYIRQRATSSERFLLVVDQFEEIFTICNDTAIRSHFDALITSALNDPDVSFHLITTIRSDFTLQFEQLPKLASLLSRRAERYYLNPIDEKGLREVLRNSMRRAGLQWDEPTLPERIITSTGREHSALPLVNKLLWLLWQRRVGNVLSARVYEELGGVGGALARSADELINSLGKDNKKRARQLLLRLIKISDDSEPTRRTISLATATRAAGGGPQAEVVLRQLSGMAGDEGPVDEGRERLIYISTSIQTGKSTVDLAHEALINNWNTLRHWINIHRDQLFAQEELEEAAHHWRKSGQPRLPGVPSRSLMKRYQLAEAPSKLAEAYLQAVRLNRWLRISLVSFMASFLLGFASFGIWINNEGLSVRTGMYLMLASTGIYYLQPEMANLPPGSFLMGATGTTDLNSNPCAIFRSNLLTQESPQHLVIIDRAFSISKYEVTFEEYDLFVRLSGSVDTPSDNGWGRGRHPVIWVSLKDANAYAKWLSDMTGKSYRLPTEAEWEYAARAGTPTNYWWGNEMEPNMANCLGCGRNLDGQGGFERTVPVGSFPANPFGLHDMAGNILEWVQDCWHNDYVNAPTNGSAWGQAANSECDGVLRGGAWNKVDCQLFNSTRYLGSPDAKDDSIGVRVVRDL